MMRALFLALLAWAAPAAAADYTDLWWNRDESGWGLTLSHQNDRIFGVWYVYDEARRPVWVVMPDGAFTADGRSFSGRLYRTTGPSYRDAAFDPARVTTTPIGEARIDFDASGTSATVAYAIDGATTVKRVARQPFGSAPANHPDDFSDLWWDPKESGWGLALTHHGDTVFGVWYTYAEDGRPFWVVLPAGRFSDAATFGGTLYTTRGGAPHGAAFDPASVKVEAVGAATIRISGDEGRFESTVNGRYQAKRIVRQRFGAPAGGNAPPTVKLDIGGAATAPASLKLKATAADSDGRVVRVDFFKGCEKIGQALAAPYELAVTGVAAGRHDFSALAVDDRGATRLATRSLEVKAPGGAPVNKAPQVALATPLDRAAYVQGATVELSASAKDADGTVVRVEYLVDGVRVAESGAAPWRATWTAAAGDHGIQAVATDDLGLGATSAIVSISVAGPAPTLDAATRDAARFLTQATFGIRGIAEIESLRARGYDAWLEEQFAMPAASHVKYVDDRKAAGEKAHEERAYEAVWQQWLWEPGQLRARMAFALSEIFVISNVAPDLDTYAMASYMDMLNRNAFGNYRQLLEEVTLHPAMGYYLNMIGSKKANPAKGTHPNENYAREVMQLFSIGLYRLDGDGSRKLDIVGRPIPTYDQSVVQGMAAAFTGWSFAGNDTSDTRLFDPAKENWLDPLIPWEMHHDTDAKTLFDGIRLPAGQSARKDMQDALDAIHRHPNVGPFVGRRLIQRFVTSNPSPASVARVAAAFDDNGRGVRGDLKAVIRAVLLDPEARSLAGAAAPTWGKQREPVIRFANFLRAFNASSASGRNRIWYLDSADEGLNQSPLLAPSVFNFFSPDYRPPGKLAFLGLVAPEFQITTETSMVGTLNFFAKLVRNGYYGNGETRLTLDLAALAPLAARPAELADRLSLLLLCGAMSEELRASIVTTLNAMPEPKHGDSASAIGDRVKAALLLVAISPEYVIQR